MCVCVRNNSFCLFMLCLSPSSTTFSAPFRPSSPQALLPTHFPVFSIYFCFCIAFTSTFPHRRLARLSLARVGGGWVVSTFVVIFRLHFCATLLSHCHRAVCVCVTDCRSRVASTSARYCHISLVNVTSGLVAAPFYEE